MSHIDTLVAAWIYAEVMLSSYVFLSPAALHHQLDLQRPILLYLAHIGLSLNPSSSSKSSMKGEVSNNIEHTPIWRARAQLYYDFANLYSDWFVRAAQQTGLIPWNCCQLQPLIFSPLRLMGIIAARMTQPGPSAVIFSNEGPSLAGLVPYWPQSLRSCAGMITSVTKMAQAKSVFDAENEININTKSNNTIDTSFVSVNNSSSNYQNNNTHINTKLVGNGGNNSRKTRLSGGSNSITTTTMSCNSSVVPVVSPIIRLCQILVGPGRYPVHTITDLFAFVMGVSLTSAWSTLTLVSTSTPTISPSPVKTSTSLSTINTSTANLLSSSLDTVVSTLSNYLPEWYCETSGGTLSVRVLPGGSSRLRGAWNVPPCAPPLGRYLFDSVPSVDTHLRWIASLIGEKPHDIMEATRVSSSACNILESENEETVLNAIAEARSSIAVLPHLIPHAEQTFPGCSFNGVPGIDIVKGWTKWASRYSINLMLPKKTTTTHCSQPTESTTLSLEPSINSFIERTKFPSEYKRRDSGIDSTILNDNDNITMTTKFYSVDHQHSTSYRRDQWASKSGVPSTFTSEPIQLRQQVN